MKINSHHFVLIFFSLLSLMVTTYGYYFIYNNTLSQARNYKIISEQANNEDYKKQSSESLNKIYNSTKPDREKLSSYFVHEDKIVSFIELIEKIGPDSGTNVELSALSKDEKNIKAKVSIKGSWTGVMTALIMLENQPFSISINNLNISKLLESDKDKTGGWWAQLNINTLIVK